MMEQQEITFNAVKAAIAEKLHKAELFDAVIDALNDYSRNARGPHGLDHIIQAGNVWSIGDGEENQYLYIGDAVQHYVHKVVLHMTAHPDDLPFMQQKAGE